MSKQMCLMLEAFHFDISASRCGSGATLQIVLSIASIGELPETQHCLFFRTFIPFWFLVLNAMMKWCGAILPRPSSSTWPVKT